ncbi:tRNA (adenosine(37)-N6)-threonylcarbamoyltransferase complex dimerization subunit type 1 TsaB [Hydrogenophaga sp.]|uniref:tRNA (adenosine(37)-N6)-threonylcarbamoyltransferase complex dimerization subunit type 1 TsaB n=1 Tax=Hydrogenophaga sp. TaxID=1904254 RepID=UPI0025C333BB|nr:tRNA (adenosine(37)-N6)-threonylcarbamoyltransferase complex dimerization subunit type 1 TsaB [Hydrogenophaga sp.]
MPAPTLKLLAIETSTDTLSVALGSGAPGQPMWQHTGPGAAQASLTLLPVIQALLAEAGWSLQVLDALVFGRGPGSFTGLRTACAVVQGLAYGARTPQRPDGLPVLPVDTLKALAGEALASQSEAGGPAPRRIAALLDARMGELYVAAYSLGDDGLVEHSPPRLCAPADFADWWRDAWPADAGHDVRNDLLAGNVFDGHGAEFSQVPGRRQPALPTARALLQLAPAALAAGEAVPPHQALPLYVRDKVAQTSVEREQLRREQLARLVAPAPVAPLDV